MEEVSWTLSTGQTVKPNTGSKKMAHIGSIKIDEKQSAPQKKFAENYNAMRQALIDAGLMETN